MQCGGQAEPHACGPLAVAACGDSVLSANTGQPESVMWVEPDRHTAERRFAL
jgi:hypothetical protein